MEKNKSILFLMHVSWFWIKQRPQFVAEGLSKSYPTTVACMEDYNIHDKLTAASTTQLELKGFSIYTVYNNKWIARLNGYLKSRQLKKMMGKHRLIWFNSPAQFTHARRFITLQHKVVYDCMDDMTAFYDDHSTKENIGKLESALVARADIIFTSANRLKQNLIEDYSPKKEITVVNNGLQPIRNSTEKLDESIVAIFEKGNFQNLVYVGTIASWFDFDVLLPILDKTHNVRLILVGPTDCTIPIHKQIVQTGAIPHSQVAQVMQMADALIMPFKITKLIEAVNPVKAYEYIASGKPVILSEYAETKVFEDFAYLYNSSSSLIPLLSALSQKKLLAKRNNLACKEFGSTNSWEKRLSQICEKIEELDF